MWLLPCPGFRLIKRWYCGLTSSPRLRTASAPRFPRTQTKYNTFKIISVLCTVFTLRHVNWRKYDTYGTCNIEQRLLLMSGDFATF